ncbi:MAG TPA: PDZ domain-containing protein, partial [Abditibacterium sp.]
NFEEEPLENRWSWRGAADLKRAGRLDLVFGWKDARHFGLLRLVRDGKETRGGLFSVADGAAKSLGSFSVPGARGELGLQKIGNRARVLWGGLSVVEAPIALAGDRFGTLAQGATLEAEAPQPTEAVVFRDDFMRAQGPDDAENPGEWKVAGVWKTSGALGPKSDAALNPNPFVFRAQGDKESVARAGKWWWSDYSVSVSVRATQNDGAAPLRAGIEAFSSTSGLGLRGEIDFARGVAYLKDGNKILAQSAAFEAEPGQWHRLHLQPGPGTAKLFVDGILRVAAPSARAQGAVALRAVAGGENHVDFDDVRVGALGGAAGQEWGEGALPSRFQKDRLMRNWASDASAWKRDAGGIWWHTGDFFGAVKLDMSLPPLDVGEGFEVLLASDAKLKSGVRFQINRPDATPEAVVRFAGQNGPTRMALAGAEMPLRLVVSRDQSGILSVKPTLGSKSLGERRFAMPKIGWGTQIGLRPLRDGAPLPPQPLQRVSLRSTTFEREGRSVIGVNITPVSPEIARRIGLSEASGAVVDNVEAGSPAFASGLREGDVIQGIDGARVTDVDSMRAAVGAVKPGQTVRLEIWRAPGNEARLDLAKCVASSPDVLDYSFTAAPVDWRAARGTWDIAERWTCSPQWSFFAGQADISPLLTSRFATQGDWTLEAYLATPMDPTRSERSPSDLNISVGGDGIELSSGYSFVFGGKNRSVNQIWRGDIVAVEKPFEMPPGAGDTHQDWFYVRLERRQTAGGVRFRYSVNGRELASYLDPKPLADGGRIGFWTQNGALSMARVRLWHSGLRAPQAATVGAPVLPKTTPPLENGLGVWSVRGEGSEASARLVLASQAPLASKTEASVLQIVNPRSGGDWTTYVTRQAFKPQAMPILEWDYRVPAGVKINLYALIDQNWREIVFSGGTSSGEGDGRTLGRVSGVVTDGNWHHARFDLLGALRSQGIAVDSVEALAFAAPARDYLRSGLGGNHRGAMYWLRDFKASQPVN